MPTSTTNIRRQSPSAPAVSARLAIVAFAVLPLLGCQSIAPRPQRGGAVTTTLGGAAAPTTATTTAPENAQTPSATTLERTITRTFAPITLSPAALPAARTISPAPSIPSTGASLAPAAIAPAGAYLAPAAPVTPLTETISERATTQLGTSQDLAGIVRAWGAAGAARWKALLWALVLAGGAWMAWRREWPLVAGSLGLGAVFSLLVAWWCGPVAVLAAALIYAARAITLSQLPFGALHVAVPPPSSPASAPPPGP